SALGPISNVASVSSAAIDLNAANDSFVEVGAVCVPPGGDTTCDGYDDDCDGLIDDDVAPLPTICGVGACAASGTPTCQGGQRVDTGAPGSPSVEICDGIDNDCDGSVDEVTPTCGTGACFATGSCDAGVVSCTPGFPSAELCDGIDNDCDGAVDED